MDSGIFECLFNAITVTLECPENHERSKLSPGILTVRPIRSDHTEHELKEHHRELFTVEIQSGITTRMH